MPVNLRRMLSITMLFILSLNVLAYPYIALNQVPEYDGKSEPPKFRKVNAFFPKSTKKDLKTLKTYLRCF